MIGPRFWPSGGCERSRQPRRVLVEGHGLSQLFAGCSDAGCLWIAGQFPDVQGPLEVLDETSLVWHRTSEVDRFLVGIAQRPPRDRHPVARDHDARASDPRFAMDVIRLVPLLLKYAKDLFYLAKLGRSTVDYFNVVGPQSSVLV